MFASPSTSFLTQFPSAKDGRPRLMPAERQSPENRLRCKPRCSGYFHGCVSVRASLVFKRTPCVCAWMSPSCGAACVHNSLFIVSVLMTTIVDIHQFAFLFHLVIPVFIYLSLFIVPKSRYSDERGYRQAFALCYRLTATRTSWEGKCDARCITSRFSLIFLD